MKVPTLREVLRLNTVILPVSLKIRISNSCVLLRILSLSLFKISIFDWSPTRCRAPNTISDCDGRKYQGPCYRGSLGGQIIGVGAPIPERSSSSSPYARQPAWRHVSAVISTESKDALRPVNIFARREKFQCISLLSHCLFGLRSTTTFPGIKYCKSLLLDVKCPCLLCLFARRLVAPSLRV